MKQIALTLLLIPSITLAEHQKLLAPLNLHLILAEPPVKFQKVIPKSILVDKETAINMAEAALQKLNALKLFELKIASFRSMEDVSYDDQGPNTPSVIAKIRAWASYIEAQPWFEPHDYYYVMTPPLQPEAYAWYYGVAQYTCAGKGQKIAIGAAGIHKGRDPFQMRVDVSIQTMVHEIKHLMGARHIDTEPNLMHSASLRYVVEGNENGHKCLPLTVKHLEACLPPKVLKFDQNIRFKARRILRRILRDCPKREKPRFCKKRIKPRIRALRHVSA